MVSPSMPTPYFGIFVAIELMKYAQTNGTPADWLVGPKTDPALPEGDKL